MSRSLNNVSKNNPRVALSRPSATRVEVLSLRKKIIAQQTGYFLHIYAEIGFKLGVPNAKIGAAIVDYDWLVCREPPVIRLPLYLRYEWHCRYSSLYLEERENRPSRRLLFSLVYLLRA